jgi:hypothetical protein
MRQHFSPPLVSLALTVLATGTFLLATDVARADTRYKIQPIVKFGDTVAGVTVKAENGAFLVYGLTDSGTITFTTWVAALRNGVAVIQYADGKFTPIAIAGGEGPVGTWPADLILYEPASMNQLGNLAFAAAAYHGGNLIDLGTFRWDARAQTVTPVARKGMPATSDLTFETGGYLAPVINNQNEIAFSAFLKDVEGKRLDTGVFLARPDGAIVPVAVPGQALPNGLKISYADNPSLNDAGVVTLRAVGEGEPEEDIYLWPGTGETDGGSITLLVAAGTAAPDGGKLARFSHAWVNDRNRNVLVLARLNTETGPAGLYLLVDGKLMPVAVRGQEMPGGGQLKDLPLDQYDVSSPNRLGQHAFMATLADGATAAYLMAADGKLSLILKAGDPTELGKVTRIGRETRPGNLARGGFCLGLNSTGQVALPVQIDDGPETIVLLTPVAR